MIGRLGAGIQYAIVCDCVNKGNVTGAKNCNSSSSGLIGDVKQQDYTNIKNSINKGHIQDDTVNGISSKFNSLSNVVSMGSLIGKSTNCFGTGTLSYLSYAYYFGKSMNNCHPSAIEFNINETNGLYFISNGGANLQGKLNEIAVEQKYSLLWTAQLDLVPQLRVTVKVTGLLNKTFDVDCGTTLSSIPELIQFFNVSYRVVDVKTKVPYSKDFLINDNMVIFIFEKAHAVLETRPIENTTENINYSLSQKK